MLHDLFKQNGDDDKLRPMVKEMPEWVAKYIPLIAKSLHRFDSHVVFLGGNAKVFQIEPENVYDLCTQARRRSFAHQGILTVNGMN